MLRALHIFIACLASFPFLVSSPRSFPRWYPASPAPLIDGKALLVGTSEGWCLEGVSRVLTGKQQPPQLPLGSTFPAVELLTPRNAGFSRQPLPDRSTFPSLNPLDLLPAKAGVPQVPVPYFPYESSPASFPECQT